MSARADWLLFADWCAAADKPALPTTVATVEAFLSAVPGRPDTQRKRLRAIRRAHANERAHFPVTLPAWSVPVRHGDTWVDVRTALEQLPTAGPRLGLRARRDGWVITLVGELGMTRGQAREVTHKDVVLFPQISVAGRVVPRDAKPARCPRCAVTRWLRVVEAAYLGRRGEVQLTLRDEDDGHDCGRGLDGSWRTAEVLMPAIDRHGWVSTSAPLTDRAITTIMKARQRPVTATPAISALPQASGRLAAATSQELAQELDDVLDGIDELDRRIQLALEQGAGVLQEIESYRSPRQAG